MVSREHYAQLDATVLDRIRRAASGGELLTVPRLSGVLYRWKELDSTAAFAKWLRGVIEKQENLVLVLEGFLQSGRSHALGDRTSKPFYRLDPEWLKPFLDPDSIVERCRCILAGKGGLIPKQKVALERSIREYDARASGKEPDAD
jgi:hypothetical protein